jgi:hypothetical protein
MQNPQILKPAGFALWMSRPRSFAGCDGRRENHQNKTLPFSGSEVRFFSHPGNGFFPSSKRYILDYLAYQESILCCFFFAKWPCSPFVHLPFGR